MIILLCIIQNLMSKRTVLVTGASRGVGEQCSLKLAESGHHVIAVARTGLSPFSYTNALDGKIDYLPADITRPQEIESVLEHLHRNDLRLDGLVHNAGLLINKSFEELSDRDWSAMIDVNLMGPVRLTRALLDRMNSGSHIVTISSMGGYQQSSKFPGLSGYSSAKGAMAILTECLAVELHDRDISVNCLCFGAVETEMFQTAFPGLQAPVTAERMGRYLSDFVLDGHDLFNGKVLPVSMSDPG